MSPRVRVKEAEGGVATDGPASRPATITISSRCRGAEGTTPYVALRLRLLSHCPKIIAMRKTRLRKV